MTLSIPGIIPTVKFVKFATRTSMFSPKEPENNPVESLYNNYYLDRNPRELRIQKVAIPSFTIHEDILEIFVADFNWDQEVFNKLNGDTLKYRIDPLISLSISGISQNPKWYKNSNPFTGQNGWLCHLSLENIPVGRNELKIDKWLWDYKAREPIFEKDYCVIPFWKTD